ncbi:MAG TPA: Abi-alpha family protein, partial [Jatrophihabitans sp.]|nr:Abi-alpha family protein [Jatrophihabitans sp.]
YVVRRAAEGEPASAIMQEAAHDLRDAAWRALGLDGQAMPARPLPGPGTTAATADDLQRRGFDLLRRSNDVRVVEDTHPAFARILTEITPDEARILRFVYLDGPQPSVDVRTRRPFGIGSVLVAQGLTMVAEHAGCRDLERTSVYLTNLSRLGLVDLSPEPVSNPQRYQVVEAQPRVADALKRAGRWPRTVHRSILLTSFGAEFVVTCLPLNGRVVQRRQLGAPDVTP